MLRVKEVDLQHKTSKNNIEVSVTFDWETKYPSLEYHSIPEICIKTLSSKRKWNFLLKITLSRNAFSGASKLC